MDKDNQGEKVRRRTPQPETLKRLFALSGNQCAFPGCKNPLFTTNYAFVGEVAHIEAAMPDGPRFNDRQTNEQRRTFNNLIALCRVHHKETDDISKYSKEVLFKMKDDHEIRFLSADAAYDVPESAISGVEIQLEILNEGIRDIKEDLTDIKSVTIGTDEKVDKMFAMMSAQMGQADTLENEYNRQLQEIIQDIEKGLVQRSLSRLLSLRIDIWDNIKDTLKYNILTQLGVCYHQLENHPKTAEIMLEAYQLRPETAPALANLVNAYMAIDDYEQASIYLDIFKEKFPDSNVAFGLDLKIKSATISLEELIKEVPAEKLEDPEILLSISMAALRQRDHHHSLKYLTKLYRSDESQEIYQQMLLQTLLNLLADDFALTNLQIINDESREWLLFAGELADKLLLIVSDSELSQVKAKLFMVRGYVHCMLKQYSEGKPYLEKSIAINPDNVHAIKLLGILNSRQGDWAAAITVWLRISDYSEVPDLPAMIAEAYAKNVEAAKGIPVLENFISDAPDSYFKTQSIHALLDFYINEDLKDKVISHIAENFKDRSIPSLISLARASNYLGQRDEAKTCVFEALELVGPETTYKDVLFLAEEFISCRCFPEAAQLYERIAIKSKDSQPTTKLYRLYHTIGETGKALAILEELRLANGPLRNATSLEIRILQQLSNYPKVIELGEQYLSAYNDDQLIHILLAGNYFRDNNLERAEELLEVEFDFANLPSNSQYALLAQLNSLGQRDRLFQIVYEYVRSENNVSSNEMFVSAFLNFSSNKETANPDVIGIDTCALLENDLGQQFDVVIEDRNDHDLLPGEIVPTDPRFSALIGKKIGDEVTFDKSRTLKIRDIIGKFEHAFIESKKKLETVFSDKSSFQTFRFQDKEKQVIPVLAVGEDLSIFQNAMIACKNLQLSFAHLAAAFDKNPLDLLEIFKSGNNSFLSTTGTFDETDAGFHEQIKKKQLCADISSLIFISELGLNSEILETFGKIVISHSTYDLIFDYSEQTKNLTQDGGAVLDLENLLRFVDQNTECRFPENLTGINASLADESEAKFGKSFFHSRLLCQSEQLILWSDDFYYRKDVADDTEVCAIWTQRLLVHMLSLGIISPEIYEQKTIHLVDLGYSHTSVNPNVLVRAFSGYPGMPENAYQKCMGSLNGENSILPSAIGVAYFFMVKVQKDGLLNENGMEQLIHNVIMDVSTNRQLRDVITGFKIILKDRLSSKQMPGELALGMNIMKEIKKINDTYFSKIPVRRF